MQKAEETKGLDIREQGKVDEVAAQLKAAMKNLKEKESRVEKRRVVRIVEGIWRIRKAQRTQKTAGKCSRKHMTKLKRSMKIRTQHKKKWTK